ncbi:hypothetical protein ACFOQM_11040 [Paenibacillus sp. GCM10012307]|uniref:Phosphoadenosine phosphosulphate reductase domain-containing protein n=1 Tax=Paenibacillus roseus TaxID=2798579 RepID=A0A934J6U7_9BACL|nr:hypothetical protein [Paenibacillus roseus]MBJ6361821.1 hypothetical protein [Paenibacillus roseus]
MKQIEWFQDYRQHKKFIDGVFQEKDVILQNLKDEGKERIFHVLSFGGGTQSAHLLEQHFRGEIHYDYIIFSDTGAEPEFIREQVRWWQLRQKQVGNTTPFLITHHGSMERGLEEMLMRYILTDYQRFQMPVYCNSVNQDGEITPAGILPRQCTVDFKIVPVKQAARKAVLELLGLKPGQRLPKDIGFIIDIGFSLDEIRRIHTYRSPQYEYIRLAYPLVEENRTTDESLAFLSNQGFPMRRSRCYLCPFHCGADRGIGMDWEEIIREEPFSFLKACWFDSRLREVQATGNKIMRSIPYLHYSRRPLSYVFEQEFRILHQSYNSRLQEWEKEWKEFIASKYGLKIVA